MFLFFNIKTFFYTMRTIIIISYLNINQFLSSTHLVIKQQRWTRGLSEYNGTVIKIDDSVVETMRMISLVGVMKDNDKPTNMCDGDVYA